MEMRTKSLLTDSAGSSREGVVRITADQPNGSDNQNENHGQHHGILGDILTFFVGPECTTKLKHTPPPDSGLISIMQASVRVVNAKL